MFQHTEQEYQELKARHNDAIDANNALRGEVERLREMNAALNRSYLIDRIVLLEADLETAKADLSRYREAVEWACGVLERSHDNPYMQPDIVAAELRRRAGEGE